MPYNKFKKELIADFEMRKDMLVVQENGNRTESLFGIKDTNDRLYNKILDQFEMVAIADVEKLVSWLCQKKGVAYGMESGKVCAYDMVLELDGVATAIEFKGQPNSMGADQMARFVSKVAKNQMPLMLVFLLKEGIESRHALHSFMSRIPTVEGVQLECVLFEEFLERAFGSEERALFCDAMVNFKEDMHKAIGYQVTELCSPYNLDKLKKELDAQIRNYDYDSIKAQRFVQQHANGQGDRDISDKEYGVIKNVFLNHGRYKLLLGNADFAESYVTSEWLYQKYFALDELDNTFIVAGYLKSIEQLLWDIIYLVGQGRDIKGVTIAPNNQNQVDRTLGALQYFLSDWGNDDLFMNAFGNGKHFVMKYLKKQISDWRDMYRNGFFHKHVLKDVQKVDAIREETYFLYMLILGTVKLSPADIHRLQ